MKITKTSSITGKTRTLDINVTEEQLLAWRNGAYIQDAMPNVSSKDREFILTGITPKEWEAMKHDYDTDEDIMDTVHGEEKE